MSGSSNKRWTPEQDAQLKILLEEVPRKKIGHIAEILGKNADSIYSRARYRGFKTKKHATDLPKITSENRCTIAAAITRGEMEVILAKFHQTYHGISMSEWLRRKILAEFGLTEQFTIS